MKICIVAACYAPSKGGVEKSVEELAKQLLNRGHTVHVITSSRGLDPTKFYNEMRESVEVTRYPETRFLFDAPINPQIAMHILKLNYDLLHVHGVTPTISDLAIIFGKLKRKPIILTYHNSPVPDYGGKCSLFISTVYVKLVDRLIIKLVNKVVTATKAFAKKTTTLRSVLEKVVTIPWGVHLPNPKPVLKELDYTSLNLLFVGQLKKYKGVRYLLKAVKILEKKGLPINVVIVGDGPERGNLETYAKTLGLKIKFTGAVSETLLHKYYASSNLLVLPSISGREAFGLVLLEAMSYGKPVIVSNIPGPNEIVNDGYNGLLVPPKSAHALVDAIKKLVTSPKFYKTLGSNAQKTAENYSWKKVGDKYEKIYQQALL